MSTSSTSHHGHGAVHVLVPIANGSEEIEATTIIDTLVRGGATVTVASVEPNLVVTCSRGVKLCADVHIDECKNKEWDLVALPGGMPGATNLRDSKDLHDILMTQHSHKKFITAICASPAVILAHHGILRNKQATGYPAQKFKDMITDYSNDRVVVDGHVITSQGPGTSLEFSLKLVEVLFGTHTAKKVATEMLVE